MSSGFGVEKLGKTTKLQQAMHFPAKKLTFVGSFFNAFSVLLTMLNVVHMWQIKINIRSFWMITKSVLS